MIVENICCQGADSGYEFYFRSNVLSGSMIPLWFMPEWMNGVIRFTPFSSIYFTPVQIYMGHLTYHEILTQCLIQTFWIVIVYAFGNFLWIKGQKKLVVQGG